MRALTTLAVYALPLTLIACDSLDVPEAGVRSETIGSMERVNPDDPNSAWVGEEIVRIVDGEGELLCQGDVDLDATAEVDGDEVTLEVLRSTIRALADDCSFSVDDVQLRSASRYLAFQSGPKSGEFSTGRVLRADSPDGPWTVFAGGVFDGERIVYRRTETLGRAVDVEGLDDWQPRDLPTRD